MELRETVSSHNHSKTVRDASMTLISFQDASRPNGPLEKKKEKKGMRKNLEKNDFFSEVQAAPINPSCPDQPHLKINYDIVNNCF